MAARQIRPRPVARFGPVPPPDSAPSWLVGPNLAAAPRGGPMAHNPVNADCAVGQQPGQHDDARCAGQSSQCKRAAINARGPQSMRWSTPASALVNTGFSVGQHRHQRWSTQALVNAGTSISQHRYQRWSTPISALVNTHRPSGPLCDRMDQCATEWTNVRPNGPMCDRMDQCATGMDQCATGMDQCATGMWTNVDQCGTRLRGFA